MAKSGINIEHHLITAASLLLFPHFLSLSGLVLEKEKESVPIHAGTHQTTSQLL